MRWLDEFRDPKLKCCRVGHKMRELERETWRKPSERGGVIDSCHEIASVCKRCDSGEGDWTITMRDPIHSFTAGSDIWDRLDKNGVFVR